MMNKDNNSNEMITQLKKFINDYNENNSDDIFEKEPLFSETLKKICDYEEEHKEEKTFEQKTVI